MIHVLDLRHEVHVVVARHNHDALVRVPLAVRMCVDVHQAAGLDGDDDPLKGDAPLGSQGLVGLTDVELVVDLDTDADAEKVARRPTRPCRRASARSGPSRSADRRRCP